MTYWRKAPLRAIASDAYSKTELNRIVASS